MTTHDVTLAHGDALTVRLSPGTQVDLRLLTQPTPQERQIVDVSATLPRHAKPYNPKVWWVRTVEQITGLTIHHTGVNNPTTLAQVCINKGCPTIQYHYFVGFDGTLYHTLDDCVGCWHDHTGHYNRNLSLGLAGYHHQSVPGEVQLTALAWLTAHLMQLYHIPLSNINGHQEWAQRAAGVATVCPGWNTAGWRDRFFGLLDL